MMAKTYRLSPENIQLLTRIWGNTYKASFVLSILILILHLIIFVIDDEKDLFLTIFGFCFLGAVAFVSYRGFRNSYRFWSSYEIELTDHSVTYRQATKSSIEIRKDEITQLRQLVPDGDIFIRTKKRRKYIQIYILVMRAHPEIKEHLVKWRNLEESSTFMFQLRSSLIAPILIAIMTPIFTLLGTVDLQWLVPGLFFYGFTIIVFTWIQKWPVGDARFKRVSWIVLLPLLMSIPLIFCRVVSMFGDST